MQLLSNAHCPLSHLSTVLRSFFPCSSASWGFWLQLWWATTITSAFALLGEYDVCGGASFVLCQENCDVDVDGFFFLTLVSTWDYHCMFSTIHYTLFLLFSLQIHFTINSITYRVSNKLGAVFMLFITPASGFAQFPGLHSFDRWWVFYSPEVFKDPLSYRLVVLPPYTVSYVPTTEASVIISCLYSSTLYHYARVTNVSFFRK